MQCVTHPDCRATRGRFTHEYAKGLVGAPEDREPAVRKLIEGAGGKLVSFYFTTGDSDFMLISEAKEAELRVPTKPAMHSNSKPAGDSDLKPATLASLAWVVGDDVVWGLEGQVAG
jgi:hypothetical protein